MFCFNCGKELPNEAKFCAYCGTRLSDLNVEVKNIKDNEESQCKPKSAKEQYTEGIKVLEKEDYKKAQLWLTKAVEGGVSKACLPLAEAYFRDEDYISISDENKYERYSDDGKMYEDYLKQNDYVMFYLLQGANDRYVNALIELCAWVILKDGTTEIRNLSLAGRINHLPDKIYNDVQTLDITQLKRSSFLSDFFESIFKNNCMIVLEKYAKKGVPAAQYYLGMYYVDKYERSVDIKDKERAIDWLQKAKDKVNSTNIYDTLSCLERVKVLNWPEVEFFV